MKESLHQESFEPRKSLDVLKEVYSEEIDIIRKLSFEMSDQVFYLENPYTPGARFRSLIEKKFKELEMESKPVDFAAYHYSVGSSPNEKQLSFDTEDNLIFNNYKEFSKNTLDAIKAEIDKTLGKK